MGCWDKFGQQLERGPKGPPGDVIQCPCCGSRNNHLCVQSGPSLTNLSNHILCEDCKAVWHEYQVIVPSGLHNVDTRATVTIVKLGEDHTDDFWYEGPQINRKVRLGDVFRVNSDMSLEFDRNISHEPDWKRNIPFLSTATPGYRARIDGVIQNNPCGVTLLEPEDDL